MPILLDHDEQPLAYGGCMLTQHQALCFRSELRAAREKAFEDAEDYDDVVHVIERLGSLLTKSQGDLGKYEAQIGALASASILAAEVSEHWPELHPPFAKLYDLVRKARNSAMHVGARARSLTQDVIRASLVLEDALMTHADRLQHFMVEDVMCAEPWQPLSFLRQRMLASSFSFLPVKLDGQWKFVADFVLARYFRMNGSSAHRKARMIETLKDAVDQGHIELLDAQICRPDDLPSTMLARNSAKPVLICRNGDREQLLGIVSPFDLL